MSDLDVVLSAAELRHLGTLAGAVPSAISPLAGPADGAVDTSHLARLGLIAPSGALAAPAAEVVSVLANARSYAGLVLQDAAIFEHVVYFDGRGRVALTNETGGFRVQDPPPALGELLRANLGEGIAVGVALDEVFTAAEAAVFLAVLDLRRRQSIAALLEDREAPATPVDPSSIAGWLARPLVASQWLAPLVRESAGARLDVSSVEAALRSLSARGAILPSGPGVIPGPTIEALASRFLIIRMLLRVRAGRIADDGSVVTADLRIAQSAGLQHLLWEADGAGRVHLECVTPTGLASTIERFLVDADALAAFAPASTPQPAPVDAAAPPPAASTPSAAPRFCPQCGTPTIPGGRFCRSCGRQMVA